MATIQPTSYAFFRLIKVFVEWFRTWLKFTIYFFVAIIQVETPNAIKKEEKKKKSPEKAFAYSKKLCLKLISGYYYYYYYNTYMDYYLLECHNRITAIEPFVNNNKMKLQVNISYCCLQINGFGVSRCWLLVVKKKKTKI